ncbi:hypothetical protein [Shouchella patagoniensis]|nr:hypothetical protein [Shouchella patagoniensis]
MATSNNNQQRGMMSYGEQREKAEKRLKINMVKNNSNTSALKGEISPMK